MVVNGRDILITECRELTLGVNATEKLTGFHNDISIRS
jgi:hypothetical protein